MCYTKLSPKLLLKTSIRRIRNRNNPGAKVITSKGYPIVTPDVEAPAYSGLMCRSVFRQI